MECGGRFLRADRRFMMPDVGVFYCFFCSYFIKFFKYFLFSTILGLIIFLGSSCKFVDIGASKDSVLFISASPLNIGVGKTSKIKVGGYDSDGTPLKDGIVIQFFTNFGTIDSNVVISNGVAFGTFRAPKDKSGVAEIIARSGSAEEQKVSINVGAAALSKLIISANPQSLPEGGGVAKIIVSAFDSDFNPLSRVPIIIKTDNGTLLRGGAIQYTNSNGQVFDSLTTSVNSKVIAESPMTFGESGEAKAISTDIVVISKNNLSASFFYSPKTPEIKDKVYFNASASTGGDGSIVRYEWDFGDGEFAKGKKVYHIYERADDYVVQLVIVNSVGSKASMSLDISVSK